MLLFQGALPLIEHFLGHKNGWEPHAVGSFHSFTCKGAGHLTIPTHLLGTRKTLFVLCKLAMPNLATLGQTVWKTFEYIYSLRRYRYRICLVEIHYQAN